LSRSTFFIGVGFSQSCNAVDRIYVNSSIYEKFVELVVQAVNALVVDDPLKPETQVGPLTRSAQLQVCSSSHVFDSSTFKKMYMSINH
jgi:acyl-CoA reductase-like NAD-dependent aldehyde dehydrogenase